MYHYSCSVHPESESVLHEQRLREAWCSGAHPEREGPMAGSRGAWQLEIPSVCRVLVIWHLGILS